MTVGNLSGVVRYIGHLDGFSLSCLFVGLQLTNKCESDSLFSFLDSYLDSLVSRKPSQVS